MSVIDRKDGGFSKFLNLLVDEGIEPSTIDELLDECKLVNYLEDVKEYIEQLNDKYDKIHRTILEEFLNLHSYSTIGERNIFIRNYIEILKKVDEVKETYKLCTKVKNHFTKKEHDELVNKSEKLIQSIREMIPKFKT